MGLDELAVVLVAVSFGGLVKGVTGMGLPPIAIPIIAIFVGVEEAVVIMAIPGVVSNVWLVVEHRAGLPSVRNLPILVGAGTIGVVIGTFLLIELDERPLQLAVAATISVYLTVSLLRPELRLSRRFAGMLVAPVGLATGVLQGAIGISSPVLASYLHALKLPQSQFVMTISMVWIIFAVLQTVAVASFGLLTADRVLAGLLALVPITIMLQVGIRVGRHLSTVAFHRLVALVMAATALRLAYVGLLG